MSVAALLTVVKLGYKTLYSIKNEWSPKDPETPIQKNLCTPMFVAAQFTTAKCWKQPKCPPVNDWIKKTVVHLHNGYYTAESKKELLPFTTACMELESLMLSELSQGVKKKYHMISPISGT